MTTEYAAETVPEVEQELPANVEPTGDELSAPAEPEAAPTQAPETAPVPRSGIELQQAFNANQPLTDAEQAALASYQRAEANRARAQYEARQLQRQNAERVRKLREEFPDRLVSKTQAEINAAVEEGRTISPTLLRNYLKEEADSLLAEIEPAVLMPREANIKAMIYRATQSVGGNAAGVLQYMDDNGYTYDQMVELHGELMHEIGKKQAPDAQEAGKLREEVTRLRAEVERLTGERGKGAPASGGREARGNARSDDELLADPTTPIETIIQIRARQKAGG